MPDQPSRRRFLVAAAVLPLAACVGAETDARPDPAGDFVTVDGVRLHYRMLGSGPPVVLIHGASGNLNDWTLGTAQAIAQSHSVLVFDRPGLGLSEAPAAGGASPFVQARLMRRAAARLGHGRAILIGHSYGGSVALAWALDAPETVAGLLLLAAPSQVWEGGLALTTELLANPVLGRLTATFAPLLATDAFVTRAIAAVFAPEAPPPGYAAHLGRGTLTESGILLRNARQLNALKDNIRRMVPRYPALEMPVEILHGTEDTTVPLEVHSEKLVTQIPDARLTRIPGAGHMIHHTRRGELLAALARLESRIG